MFVSMWVKFLIGVGVLALCGALVFGVSGLGARAARSVIYQPPADVTSVSLDGLPQGGEVVTVRTQDGLDLKGIVYRSDGELDMLLMFHGNAMTAQQAAAWFRPLIDAGYSMIFAEYRGYSGNPGSPSEKGTALDAAAWSDLAYKIAMKEHHAQRVYYIGHSLGGGAAFQAAEHAPPAALITIGTFADTPSLAPAASASLIADRYDNRAKVARLVSPYFILHGTADPVIPVAHSGFLFDAAKAVHKEGARFVMAGEGHNPDIAKIAQIIGYVTMTDGKADAPPLGVAGVEVTRFSASKPTIPKQGAE